MNLIMFHLVMYIDLHVKKFCGKSRYLSGRVPQNVLGLPCRTAKRSFSWKNSKGPGS